MLSSLKSCRKRFPTTGWRNFSPSLWSWTPGETQSNQGGIDSFMHTEINSTLLLLLTCFSLNPSTNSNNNIIALSTKSQSARIISFIVPKSFHLMTIMSVCPSARCLTALPGHVLQHHTVQLFFTASRPRSPSLPPLPSSPPAAPVTPPCPFTSSSGMSLFSLQNKRLSNLYSK